MTRTLKYIGEDPEVLSNFVSAVASGTLADGSTVVVNANGTVSVVAGAGIGADVIFETGNNATAISAVFQSNTNQVIIFYRDTGNSNYGTAIAGSVNASDNSIAFGTAHVFATHTIYSSGSAFDTNSERAVVTYSNASSSAHAIVGHISSGTNFTFGSAITLSSNSSSHFQAVFDSTNNRVVLFWKESNVGKAVVGNITASNNSIAVGSVVQFSAGNFDWRQGNTGTTFDTNAGKIVIAYKDSNQSPNRGVVNVGTVTASNNSIAFGSPVVIDSSNTADNIDCLFIPTINKVVFAFTSPSDSVKGKAVVGTVNGTSMDFGTIAVWGTDTNNYNSALTFNSSTNIITLFNQSVVGSTTSIKVGDISVSGTNLTFGTRSVFSSFLGTDISIVFDNNSNRTVVVTQNTDGSLDKGIAIVYQNATTGANVAQSVSASTLIASEVRNPYFSVFDTNANRILFVYKVSNPGLVQVGSLSGSSITFGSSVTIANNVRFNNSNNDLSMAFDSNVNKTIIVYSDLDNSSYGTAVAATISGTTVSLGTRYVYKSASASNNCVAFDPNTNNCFIQYRDDTNSYRPAYIGATIASNSSISFGTAGSIATSQEGLPNLVMDTNLNKLVYTGTNSSNKGIARVGTINGTSVSWGSAVEYEQGATTNPFQVFDSNSNTIVFVYVDGGNSSYGTAVVGTVSGTSISFGTPVVFNAGSTGAPEAAFDSTAKKVVICYSNNSNSQRGTAIAGEVSGTTISFGTGIVYETDETPASFPVYDSTANKVVITYLRQGGGSTVKYVLYTTPFTVKNLTAENYIGISDGAYSDGANALIQAKGAIDDAQSNLTPGQTYFVQADGTLGTTADDPSVFAGTAISSTQLIVKG